MIFCQNVCGADFGIGLKCSTVDTEMENETKIEIVFKKEISGDNYDFFQY